MKKGTNQHPDGWYVINKVRVHMVLHLSHDEGGYEVTFNNVTKDATYYTTTSCFVTCLGAFSQERHRLWLSKDDLRDSSSWSSSPLLPLRDIHCKLVTQYDCKEVCAPSQSQVNVEASARLRCQDDVSQQQGTVPLSLPQINRLFESAFVRDESFASNADVADIPSQDKVTQQILNHCDDQLSKDLSQVYYDNSVEKIGHLSSTTKDLLKRLNVDKGFVFEFFRSSYFFSFVPLIRFV